MWTPGLTSLVFFYEYQTSSLKQLKPRTFLRNTLRKWESPIHLSSSHSCTTDLHHCPPPRAKEWELLNSRDQCSMLLSHGVSHRVIQGDFRCTLILQVTVWVPDIILITVIVILITCCWAWVTVRVTWGEGAIFSQLWLVWWAIGITTIGRWRVMR